MAGITIQPVAVGPEPVCPARGMTRVCRAARSVPAIGHIHSRILVVASRLVGITGCPGMTLLTIREVLRQVIRSTHRRMGSMLAAGRRITVARIARVA